ncbi:hypothetical protein BIFADO_00130 [Bifidobacterium adolescentis L2-32]|uniref:Uncharacterized protein n=1 Tax=Bifidobacterium adolescentis L2-32 TaxID=411481 RepID=A7A2U7_BIFAD|nr:hypothetical protein BIFADO_00130 [Bifidobacterium adolescentis L2-32]
MILITKRHVGSDAFIGTAKPFNTAPHLMVSVKWLQMRAASEDTSSCR